MLRANKLAPLLLGLATCLPAMAAEGHGMDQRAEELFHVGPLPITNSMVTSWVVAAVLILAVRFFVGRPKLIPSRGQAIVENLLEGLRDLTAPIVGPKASPAAFPILVGFFVFILIQNWSGLVPGVGTVFMRDHATGGWMEFVRPGNADMNSTFALAAVSFIAWLYLIIRFAGPKAIIVDLFGNKADRRDVALPMYLLLSLIFLVVGVIEIISIIFRPISLSFRLFGNVFGGENLLHAMSSISRWGLPFPFYFMELLVGLVQALVFTLLVSVYVGLICNHGDGHDAAHPEPDGAAHH